MSIFGAFFRRNLLHRMGKRKSQDVWEKLESKVRKLHDKISSHLNRAPARNEPS